MHVPFLDLDWWNTLRLSMDFFVETFLSSLTVITEADLEEASRVAWPESVSHCSAFTKLFEDQRLVSGVLAFEIFPLAYSSATDHHGVDFRFAVLLFL